MSTPTTRVNEDRNVSENDINVSDVAINQQERRKSLKDNLTAFIGAGGAAGKNMVGGSLNTGKTLVFGGFMMVLLVASCVVKPVQGVMKKGPRPVNPNVADTITEKDQEAAVQQQQQQGAGVDEAVVESVVESLVGAVVQQAAQEEEARAMLAAKLKSHPLSDIGATLADCVASHPILLGEEDEESWE